MIDETLEQLQDNISKAHEALQRELAKLRTGRASPELLESVRVDYYGSPTQLKQMATISVPEPRMLAVKAFDRTQVKAIERAIMSAGLGLNPQSDGELIRVPLPMLTEERRKDLVKLAREQGEECKISIRRSRPEAKDLLDALQKDGDASEDDVERAMKKVEEVVQAGTSKTDTIVARKEKDILEI